MSRTRRVVLVSTVVAVVVAAGVVALRSTASESRAWRVDAVEELPANRLRVHYGLPSPCDEVERLDVEESPAAVALSLRISDDGGDCTANIEFGSRIVQLERPLGSRRVVDRGCGERATDRCDELDVKRR